MKNILAQVQPYAFNFEPKGWLLCNGMHLKISDHTALFSLLGARFGGDGRTHFALPEIPASSQGFYHYICINGEFPEFL